MREKPTTIFLGPSGSQTFLGRGDFDSFEKEILTVWKVEF
jgi:hypothetical protein